MVWEAISKTRKSVSSGIQTPRSRSTHFSGFGYPDETLFLVFDILLGWHNFEVRWAINQSIDQPTNWTVNWLVSWLVSQSAGHHHHHHHLHCGRTLDVPEHIVVLSSFSLFLQLCYAWWHIMCIRVKKAYCTVCFKWPSNIQLRVSWPR